MGEVRCCLACVGEGDLEIQAPWGAGEFEVFFEAPFFRDLQSGCGGGFAVNRIFSFFLDERVVESEELIRTFTNRADGCGGVGVEDDVLRG